MALSNIKGETLSQWVKQLSSKLHPDSFQTFDLVKEFLQTAGQSNMVSQVCVNFFFTSGEISFWSLTLSVS